MSLRTVTSEESPISRRAGHPPCLGGAFRGPDLPTTPVLRRWGHGAQARALLAAAGTTWGQTLRCPRAPPLTPPMPAGTFSGTGNRTDEVWSCSVRGPSPW